MPIGPFVRRMFGTHERYLSELYRSMYVDIDSFIGLVRQWKPVASNILEVGCGEGAVTERLAASYPQSAIRAIDITPRIGRLYAGPLNRVTFERCLVQEISAREPLHYDLVVLSDVLHHVPIGIRPELLSAIRQTIAPQGVLIFKDWERSFSMIHWMSYLSDRWLTGDRISYMSLNEMRDLLIGAFGANSLIEERRVAPRWNNFAALVRAHDMEVRS